jgi:hypothetical protein
MANTIRLRRSAVPSAQPTTAQLALGEVAINTYDGKLYIKKDNGNESIVEIGAGGSGASVTVSDTAPSSPSAGALWFNSTNGTLSIYYNDGDSSQWVVTSGATGATGPAGPTGSTGQGVPIGGTTGQVLAKVSGTDYDTQWVDQTGGSGGTDQATVLKLVSLRL